MDQARLAVVVLVVLNLRGVRESIQVLLPIFLAFLLSHVGILLFGLGGLLWFLVPWWDARTPAGSRNRVLNYVGIGVVLFIIVFTVSQRRSRSIFYRHASLA